VERIGYGERRFGRTAAERQIGADGNRPQLALDLTQREQRRLARRIARITERVQQYLVGIGEAEEAAPATRSTTRGRSGAARRGRREP